MWRGWIVVAVLLAGCTARADRNSDRGIEQLPLCSLPGVVDPTVKLAELACPRWLNEFRV